MNIPLWVPQEDNEQLKAKGSPIFPKPSPSKYPGWLWSAAKIGFFPQSVQSPMEDLALCSSFLDLYPIARGWRLEPAKTEVSTSLQLLSVTHLGVICKTRVDSLRWICPLQWASSPSSRAYILLLRRNLMHRLCNRHWSKAVKAVGWKMCPVDRAVLFMYT